MLITILSILLAALYVAYKLLESVWVGSDAARLGSSSPCVWAVLVFFLPFAVIVYLFARAGLAFEANYTSSADAAGGASSRRSRSRAGCAGSAVSDPLSADYSTRESPAAGCSASGRSSVGSRGLLAAALLALLAVLTLLAVVLALAFG